MTKQSKGPLTTKPVRGTSLTEIRNGDGYWVATVRWPETAQRIVACMNACAGVDDETLLIAATCSNPGLGRIIQAAISQRDDLLSALGVLVESYGYTSYTSDDEKENDADVINARAAIARVKPAA